MLQKKEFKSRQPNVGMMGRPSRRRERSQPARLRLRRQSLPTGLPSPMAPRQRLRRQCLLTGLPGPKTRRSPSHPACLWWEVPGLTVAQCLPGPTVLNTTDHAVVIGVDEVTGQTDATIRQGPGRHHQEGPALEPGTLIRRMFRGLVVLQIGRRRSGLPAQPLVIIVIRHSHHWIVDPGWDLGSMTGVKCGQREVWVFICIQKRGAVVPSSCTEDWEENRHSDPLASQTISYWLLGRCDGPSRFGSFIWLCRCDGPCRLARGGWLSRLRVSRGSRIRSGRAGDCVRLSNCCRLSTASGLGRWRLSKPTESSRQRLGTTTRLGTCRIGKEWRASSPGYSGRDCTSR